MKKTIASFIAIVALPLMLMGCDPTAQSTDNRTAQAKKAADAAQSIQFTDNTEIENITKRLKLFANPGQIGYVVLLNGTGQPIKYVSVKGKITSGGKRLTPPDRASAMWGSGQNTVVRSAPSDEGTYGSSGRDYIYFWTVNNEYVQWSGDYLYSDQPIRLTIAPLVFEAKAPEGMPVTQAPASVPAEKK